MVRNITNTIIDDYIVKAELTNSTPTSSYTYKKNLSRKIYSTIHKTGANKNALTHLMEKTKEFKKLLEKYEFFKLNSSIYLVEVSDPSKLDAQLNDKVTNNIDYIKINRLASSEVIESKKLRPEEHKILEDGTYKFNINIDNEVISIDFSVSNSDISTNKGLLDTLAYVINSLDLGLTADIYTTKKRSLNPSDPNSLIDYIYLKITNNNTGYEHYFQLQDIENNLVKTLELDKTYEASHRGEYYFNSKKKTTWSNEVNEKNGKLTLNLLDSTNDFIHIKENKLNGDILKYIVNIIDEFNKYIDWIYTRQNLFSKRLISDIKDVISDHYKDLKEMDLSLDPNDKIITGPYFKEIINTDPDIYLSHLFGEEGFFTDIKNTLDNIIKSPANYQLTDDELSLYTRYGNDYSNKGLMGTNTIHLVV
ncbi:hypothetical protein JCM13304A_10100 [Desulfothermus okinawensis JCM 13304]